MKEEEKYNYAGCGTIKKKTLETSSVLVWILQLIHGHCSLSRFTVTFQMIWKYFFIKIPFALNFDWSIEKGLPLKHFNTLFIVNTLAREKQRPNKMRFEKPLKCLKKKERMTKVMYTLYGRRQRKNNSSLPSHFAY